MSGWRRRDFVALLGSAAAAWPLAARAQQSPSAVRHIGILSTGFSNVEAARSILDPFRQGLRQLGWVEGQNVSIEYRFAAGKPHHLPELASELIRLQSEVIVTAGDPATLAAKNASSTVAVVMATSGDPVGAGLVASLNRPGGNVTGLGLLSSDLAGKRLQLLAEIIPGLARVAALFNPLNPTGIMALKQTQSAAPSLNIELQPIAAHSPEELTTILAAMDAARPGAFIIMPDGMLYGQRARVVAFAAASRLPALFPEPELAQEGGLIAYGPSVPANFHRAAALVDKILRGTRPADLPVEQPAKLELAINLKTAKALGLTMPPTLLALANEVIE
jgi:putative tryptophan/tyrosine transport system substrate-binding protein